MRFFLIITTALAFSFSANAEHHIKRASENEAQSCTAGLRVANFHFSVLKAVAKNQYIYRQASRFNEPLLESFVQSAISNCCASLVLPDEEVDSVVSTFDITTNRIIDVYDVFISKDNRSFSAASAFAIATLKDTIRSFSHVIKNLDECLLSVTPSSRQSEIQTYIDTINNKIDTAFTTYEMTA